MASARRPSSASSRGDDTGQLVLSWLERIEARMDAMGTNLGSVAQVQAGHTAALEAIQKLATAQNGRVAEVEKRVGLLERWQSGVRGQLMVIGVIATAALSAALGFGLPRLFGP